MQDFLFLLKMAQDKGLITDDIEIWIDGSLGISNTFLIFNNPETFLIKDSARKFLPRNLKIAGKDFRQHIAFSPNKKIIVTSSGDGSFGPARQYLSWKVSDKNTLILFGGYCTKGSLGHKLINTPYGEHVDIFGNSIIKKATVYNIEEVSAHGRSDVQENYVRIMQPKSVVVNHGDPEKQEAEKNDIQQNIHPSKGTFVSSRNTLFVINSYGVKKVINNCKLKYF
jgi:predicted metal-dependent RNase